jgi:hypothetical protein
MIRATGFERITVTEAYGKTRDSEVARDARE